MAKEGNLYFYITIFFPMQLVLMRYNKNVQLNKETVNTIWSPIVSHLGIQMFACTDLMVPLSY